MAAGQGQGPAPGVLSRVTAAVAAVAAVMIHQAGSDRRTASSSGAVWAIESTVAG